MKKIFFIVALLSVTMSYGQSLTLEMFVKLHKTNKLVDLEDDLMKEGFLYNPMKILNVKAEEQNFLKKGTTDKQDRMFGKVVLNGETLYSTFLTPFPNDYLELKRQVKELGYTFLSTTTEGEVSHKYEKDGYQLEFTTRYFEEDRMTFYSIKMLRLADADKILSIGKN